MATTAVAFCLLLLICIVECRTTITPKTNLFSATDFKVLFVVIVVLGVITLAFCCLRVSSNRRRDVATYKMTAEVDTEGTQPQWIAYAMERHDTSMMPHYGWGLTSQSEGVTISGASDLDIALNQMTPLQGVVIARGSHAASYGKHIFEYFFENSSVMDNKKTIIRIGVGTGAAACPNDFQGEHLGDNRNAWAVDLHYKRLYWGGLQIGRYPKHKCKHFKIPNHVYMYLDMDDGTLAFGTDDDYWGVAFRNLKRNMVPLYPLLSASKHSGRVCHYYNGSVTMGFVCPPEFACRNQLPRLANAQQTNNARDVTTASLEMSVMDHATAGPSATPNLPPSYADSQKQGISLSSIGVQATGYDNNSLVVENET